MGLRKRILIVDNDPGVLALLSDGLAAPDREIDSVRDLPPLETASYDLVLAEVDFIQHIHQLRPDMKAVAITAACNPESVLCALRERAFAFISKPLVIGAVSDFVDRALIDAPWQDDIDVLSAR